MFQIEWPVKDQRIGLLFYSSNPILFYCMVILLSYKVIKTHLSSKTGIVFVMKK